MMSYNLINIKKIIFMGTPDFAVPTLSALCENSLKPVLVISQPDKAKGRNLKLQETPVKLFAISNNIPVFQPDDINSLESINYIKSFSPDIIITVAYGAFLSKDIRTLCPFGAINLHPSLLPLHRGADPVRNTLLSGDSQCGVSVFFITAKMDSGNMIIQNSFDISDDMNFSSLSNFLSNSGAEAVLQSLLILDKSELRYSDLKKSFPEQIHSLATFSKKLVKDDYLYNPDLTANELIIKIKSYSNEPGYVASFRGKKLKLLNAKICDNNSNTLPGTIVSIIKNTGFVIATTTFDVLIYEVQYEGKKAMSAWNFNIGARINIGEKIE